MKYKAQGKKEFSNYSIVTDTPVYVTAVLGHTWASDVSAHIFLFVLFKHVIVLQSVPVRDAYTHTHSTMQYTLYNVTTKVLELISLKCHGASSRLEKCCIHQWEE